MAEYEKMHVKYLKKVDNLVCRPTLTGRNVIYKF